VWYCLRDRGDGDVTKLGFGETKQEFNRTGGKMRESITSTVVTCDACKCTNPSCTEHRIDNSSVDLCPECERLFNNILSGKDFEVALNMNKSVSVCLGEDSADSCNRYWAGYKTLPVKAGEWRRVQFWSFLQECTDAFRKAVGSTQKIAVPFEIRMRFSDLNVVEDQAKE